MNGTMLRRGIMITVTLMLQLLIAKAVMASSGSGGTPWYGAWYLWIGLGIFIIVIVSVTGSQKNPE
jgi:hypothetical protein